MQKINSKRMWSSLIVCLTVICFAYTALKADAQWQEHLPGQFIDTSSISVEDNMLRMRIKTDNVGYLNQCLQKSNIALEQDFVSFVVMEYVFDCEVGLFKIPITEMYDKNGELLTTISDNTWHSNITQGELASLCSLMTVGK